MWRKIFPYDGDRGQPCPCFEETPSSMERFSSVEELLKTLSVQGAYEMHLTPPSGIPCPWRRRIADSVDLGGRRIIKKCDPSLPSGVRRARTSGRGSMDTTKNPETPVG
jgi:hypothetical protein